MIKNIVLKMVDDSHFYYVDGEFYPSVTRILDLAAPKEYGLLNWFKNNTAEDIEAISNEAKGNGSTVHDGCEKLLNGIEIPLKDYTIKAKKALWSFYQWYLLNKPTKLITEHSVASVKYRYAGTLDLVCSINGLVLNAVDKGTRADRDYRVLIDFKTNKGGIYFTNKLQILAYKQAFEETTGESIDECWALRLGSQHKCGYEFKRVDREVGIEDFMNVYNVYLRINGGQVEEPPIINVYPDVLKLEDICEK